LLLVALTSAVLVSGRAHAVTADGTAGAGPIVSVQPQEDGEEGVQDGAASEPDERVEVQVWTVAAAGIALAIGLVLCLVRILMGWVKPVPAQEDAHH
jgi:hypothetical protein